MISVLIPAYNAERYIGAALESVLTQNVEQELEVIVVDDGSTDKTADVVRDVAVNAQNIQLLQTANQGVSAARNLLLEHINPKTRFVTFLDADDAFASGRLLRDVAFFEQNPELQVIYGQLCLVATELPNLKNLHHPNDQRVRGISVTAGTYRIELIVKTGGFDTSFTQGEDLDFLLRMFEREPKALLIDEISVFYRQHGKNTTQDKAGMRRGIMKAMLFHTKRLRADPSLVNVDGLFDVNG